MHFIHVIALFIKIFYDITRKIEAKTNLYYLYLTFLSLKKYYFFLTVFYLCVAPGGPVDVRGAEADQRHPADHRVRQDGPRLHEVPPGGPDCPAQSR